MEHSVVASEPRQTQMGNFTYRVMPQYDRPCADDRRLGQAAAARLFRQVAPVQAAIDSAYTVQPLTEVNYVPSDGQGGRLLNGGFSNELTIPDGLVPGRAGGAFTIRNVGLTALAGFLVGNAELRTFLRERTSTLFVTLCYQVSHNTAGSCVVAPIGLNADVLSPAAPASRSPSRATR